MMNSELSSYTISVFELKEYNFDFGLNDYPIFDEKYRETLNNAILEYYMFREIGFANPAVWRQKLRNRMDIIMRNKYNAMYKAKQMEFNPLYTMELYEDYTHTNTSTGENTNKSNSTNSVDSNTNGTTTDVTNSTSDGLNTSSSFPSDETLEGDLTSNLFVDSAGHNKSTDNSTDSTTQNTSGSEKSTSDGTSNGTNTNNSIETFSKKTIGSASDLTFAHAMVQFKEYCDKFNLDQLVIDELKDLFMTVW